KERPVAAHVLDERWIAGGDQDLLALAGVGQVATEWIGDERMAEERDSVGAGLVFVSDAIRRRHIHTVGDRMGSLHRPPRINLRLAPLLFLFRVPANRCPGG